jgi:fatty acid desaturase
MGAHYTKAANTDDAFSVDFYRTKLPPDVSARLLERSDARGLLQAGGWLGVLLGAGALAVRASLAGDAARAAAWSLVYGCVANFAINGMHELGHETVFKTPALNALFLRIISFVGWLHPDLFFSSHHRHHRFTQHEPHDQENPMPIRVTLRGFLLFGFVNVVGAFEALQQTVYAAVGRHPTGHLGWRAGWEDMLYPPSAVAERRSAARWAQVMLAGHALFAAACISRGVYLAPFLLSCGPFFNGWLFFLCNSTQHVGLEPSVADFRRNTRTFYLNPVASFLYWSMNYHIEHHMYPRVPCYNLAALHEAIKHDLPPTPRGLVGVWRVIAADMRALAKDPGFCEKVALPKARAAAKKEE